MSLLTVCQNVADEIGISRPSTIINNTDSTAVRIYRNFLRTGKILAQKDWPQLIKPETITTSSGEPQYDLPADFRSFVTETMWNRTTDKQVFLISPQLWAYEKSVNVSTFDDRFRIMGNDAVPSIGQRITIHPTPSAAETIAYEYYSTNWLTDSGATSEKATPTADSDEVILDEDLIEMGTLWRVLKTMGQPYLEEKVDFDRQLEIKLAQAGGTEKLSTDGHTATLSNIPETGFGT